MPFLALADRHRNAIELVANSKRVLLQQEQDVRTTTDALMQVEAEVWGKAPGWEECDPCTIPREVNPYVPAEGGGEAPAQAQSQAAAPAAQALDTAHGAPAADAPPPAPPDPAPDPILTTDDLSPKPPGNKKGR